LGEAHDGALLGAVTLETLGLILNPLTREILPMQMGAFKSESVEVNAAAGVAVRRQAYRC